MDRYITLILIYLTFNLPIVIWIVTDQFRGIPYDLDEAARMEGASQFMTMLGAPIGQVRRGSAPGHLSDISDAHATLLRGHGAETIIADPTDLIVRQNTRSRK